MFVLSFITLFAFVQCDTSVLFTHNIGAHEARYGFKDVWHSIPPELALMTDKIKACQNDQIKIEISATAIYRYGSQAPYKLSFARVTVHKTIGPPQTAVTRTNPSVEITLDPGVIVTSWDYHYSLAHPAFGMSRFHGPVQKVIVTTTAYRVHDPSTTYTC